MLLLALGYGCGGGGGTSTSTGTSTGTGTSVVGEIGGGSSRGRTADEALLPLVSAPLLPRAARAEQLKLVRAAFAFLCAFCHGCSRNQEVASSLSLSLSPGLNPSLNPSPSPSLNLGLNQASRPHRTRTPHPSPLTPHPVLSLLPLARILALIFTPKLSPLIFLPQPRSRPHQALFNLQHELFLLWRTYCGYTYYGYTYYGRRSLCTCSYCTPRCLASREASSPHFSRSSTTTAPSAPPRRAPSSTTSCVCTVPTAQRRSAAPTTPPSALPLRPSRCSTRHPSRHAYTQSRTHASAHAHMHIHVHVLVHWAQSIK